MNMRETCCALLGFTASQFRPGDRTPLMSKKYMRKACRSNITLIPSADCNPWICVEWGTGSTSIRALRRAFAASFLNFSLSSLSMDFLKA